MKKKNLIVVNCEILYLNRMIKEIEQIKNSTCFPYNFFPETKSKTKQLRVA